MIIVRRHSRARETAHEPELTLAIEIARRLIADRTVPLPIRVRRFWAAAKHARDLAVSDVHEEEFTRLAQNTGLLADLDHFDPVLRRRVGDDDLRHILAWAGRGRNPFAKGR